MSLQLYDTLTRSLKEFEPSDPPAVFLYACGPTVYDHAHIGNYRSFLVYDLLHRYLVWSGYKVRFVMNLTDVDDKTILRASEADQTIKEYTGPFGEQILEDAENLGILPAEVYPLATDYIEEMIVWTKRLIENGTAYSTTDGSVYFSIASFSEYGRLKGLDLETSHAVSRVDSDEYEKENVRDFVLWKAAKSIDEKVGASWDSPWGRGRPGWHLECSVMSIKELGETLDIHMGGEDLVFPHHENEIAQSEAVTGKPFVRHWVHVKHLIVEGHKMSKSLGNTITVRQLLEEGFEPAAIRHQLLSAQYRKELNFTRKDLGASASAVQRIVDFEARLNSLKGLSIDGEGPLSYISLEAIKEFQGVMDDDLNSAEALAVLFVFINRANGELDSTSGVSQKDAEKALETLRSMDMVLGLLAVARESRRVDPSMEKWVESLVAERATARQNGDFERADQIRDELISQGIVLEDSDEETRWKKSGH
ncbi:MAG TPA: cysteine--tRNA ligase [Gemmatimonadetes bacterium]|nr:cysteine--tRNA ligase [Gemmatimonadota bacterium]